jgi:transposase
MGRAYSNDLRERVVKAVTKGGLSRHQAAAQFGVAISAAINWVRRFHGHLFEARKNVQKSLKRTQAIVLAG